MSSSLPPSSLCAGVDSFPAHPHVDLVPSPISWGGFGSASLGLRFPLRLRHLPVLAGGSQRGALHEEDILQAAAPLLHSSGDWNSLLQRPLPAHSRGRDGTGGSVVFFSFSLGMFLAGEGEGGVGGERRVEVWRAGVWEGIAP